MAKSVSAVAHRNLYRRENDADRLRGVLGIHVARARRPLAVFELDSRDGAIRPSQTEEFMMAVLSKGRIKSPAATENRELLRALARRCGFAQKDTDLGALADACNLGRGRAVSHDFEIAHAAEKAKDFPRRALRESLANVRNLAASYHDLEFSGLRKKRRSVCRSHIRDQVAEAIDLQHHGTQAVLAGSLGLGRGEAYVIFNFIAELVRIHLFCQIRCHRSEYIARMKCIAHRLPEVMCRT